MYHNVYRKVHDAYPLVHDDYAALHAQYWANHLASTLSCISHDPAKRFGENIFFYAATVLPSETVLAKMTVHSFFIESKDYNYNNHENLDYHTRGHFTQLVWRSTKKLGIGVAIAYSSGNHGNPCMPNFPATAIYVVIKYDPPGNVHSLRHYSNNVLPPTIPISHLLSDVQFW
ncbi:unnamed protein product [Enterobius vermicularis]|uniref:SCP domain-containing protein n=1 Tax=Enterobius vermicularis TaxID=51028 RepID=A0A0N4V7D8_ENTVE|nr:unnamed protein product [Enterobius vermicularis]